MPIIFNIVNKQSWKWKFVKSFYIATNWSIHQQELRQRRLLVNCIENGSPTLRVTKHCKIRTIVEIGKNFLKHLERESLNCFFAAFGTTIAGAINRNDKEFLNVTNSHQVLMQKVHILV